MAVPDSFREGSFGLGAGKLRTVFRIVLPSAIPGILSGVILSTGRIAGETAALIYTAGTMATLPKNLLSSGRTLAVHMYVLSQEGLHTDQAFATAVILLVMVLLINIFIFRYRKENAEGLKYWNLDYETKVTGKRICKQQYVREDNETNMLKNKMTIEHMNLHYGDFHALKDINLEIKEHQITAFIGPSGCGKSTLLKSLNRMNDLVEGCKIDGLIALDGEDIYGNNMDVNLLRKRVGMVFQKANPFPMSIYDNVAFGPRTHGIHNKAQLDDIVEKSLRDAAIWDEVKDRLKKSALGVSGWTAAENLYCPCAGSSSGSITDG